MNQIKQLLINPVEFHYADHVPDDGKHYYACADAHGHVRMPAGIEPGDRVTVQYEVPNPVYLRIPTLEPKRLPRSQRIPHLTRGGFHR